MALKVLDLSLDLIREMYISKLILLAFDSSNSESLSVSVGVLSVSEELLSNFTDLVYEIMETVPSFRINCSKCYSAIVKQKTWPTRITLTEKTIQHLIGVNRLFLGTTVL